MRVDVVRGQTGRLSDAKPHAEPYALADNIWPYVKADNIWSFAYAAPHAPAADAWSFARTDAAPHTRADAEADARADAGPDAGADARPNDGQGCLVCDAGGHRRD